MQADHVDTFRGEFPLDHFFIFGFGIVIPVHVVLVLQLLEVFLVRLDAEVMGGLEVCFQYENRSVILCILLQILDAIFRQHVRIVKLIAHVRDGAVEHVSLDPGGSKGEGRVRADLGALFSVGIGDQCEQAGIVVEAPVHFVLGKFGALQSTLAVGNGLRFQRPASIIIFKALGQLQ